MVGPLWRMVRAARRGTTRSLGCPLRAVAARRPVSPGSPPQDRFGGTDAPTVAGAVADPRGTGPDFHGSRRRDRPRGASSGRRTTAPAGRACRRPGPSSGGRSGRPRRRPRPRSAAGPGTGSVLPPRFRLRPARSDEEAEPLEPGAGHHHRRRRRSAARSPRARSPAYRHSRRTANQSRPIPGVTLVRSTSAQAAGQRNPTTIATASSNEMLPPASSTAASRTPTANRRGPVRKRTRARAAGRSRHR